MNIIIMKKNYNQPIVEQAEMQPQSIICASITPGGKTSEGGEGGSPMYSE